MNKRWFAPEHPGFCDFAIYDLGGCHETNDDELGKLLFITSDWIAKLHLPQVPFNRLNHQWVFHAYHSYLCLWMPRNQSLMMSPARSGPELNQLLRASWQSSNTLRIPNIWKITLFNSWFPFIKLMIFSPVIPRNRRLRIKMLGTRYHQWATHHVLKNAQRVQRVGSFVAQPQVLLNKFRNISVHKTNNDE